MYNSVGNPNFINKSNFTSNRTSDRILLLDTSGTVAYQSYEFGSAVEPKISDEEDQNKASDQ